MDLSENMFMYAWNHVQIISMKVYIIHQWYMYNVNVCKTNCINSISGSMRLVRREIIQTRKLISIYHIPHFTINWAYTTRVAESWDVSSVVMSCYVCGIMISTRVSSMFIVIIIRTRPTQMSRYVL